MLSKHAIRVIYDQGIEAVAATIRQLYDLIEVEDERVHKLVVAANAAHLQKIEQLAARITRLEEELANKVRQFHQLNLAVKELNKQLKEARRQTRQARGAAPRALDERLAELFDAAFSRPAQADAELAGEERQETGWSSRPPWHDLGLRP